MRSMMTLRVLFGLALMKRGATSGNRQASVADVPSGDRILLTFIFAVLLLVILDVEDFVRQIEKLQHLQLKEFWR